MSKSQYAVQPGSVAEVNVDGRKMQVGSFQVGPNWGSWTTQGDGRLYYAADDAAAARVSAETLKAAEKAIRDEAAQAKLAAAAGMKLPTGHLKGSPWVKSEGSPWVKSAAPDKSARRTEIAVRLLGEMLRARVPSAVDEQDFAHAITRLAIEGDGERMTKLAFFLADQVLAEEAAGNH